MKRKSKSSRTKATRKTSASKPAKKNILAITTEIEKEFFSLPAKIVVLCRREQQGIKQNQVRLSTNLKNAESKHSAGIKRLAALKKSGKKASQKQILATKKSVTAAGRLMSEIKREISLVQKSTDTILKKQAGFALLAKELPSLRRKMAGVSIKSQKAPANSKKKRSSVKPQTGTQDRIQPDYQTNLPTFSTRSDSTDLS